MADHHDLEARLERLEKQKEDLYALLGRYDLRDGFRPGEPYQGNWDVVGRGWFGLVKELIEDLIRLGWDRTLYQVKEKFGTLRFYVHDVTPEMRGRIAAAERLSAETCEECGKRGSRKTKRQWCYTRCDACWEKERRR